MLESHFDKIDFDTCQSIASIDRRWTTSRMTWPRRTTSCSNYKTYESHQFVWHHPWFAIRVVHRAILRSCSRSLHVVGFRTFVGHGRYSSGTDWFCSPFKKCPSAWHTKNLYIRMACGVESPEWNHQRMHGAMFSCVLMMNRWRSFPIVSDRFSWRQVRRHYPRSWTQQMGWSVWWRLPASPCSTRKNWSICSSNVRNKIQNAYQNRSKLENAFAFPSVGVFFSSTKVSLFSVPTKTKCPKRRENQLRPTRISSIRTAFRFLPSDLRLHWPHRETIDDDLDGTFPPQRHWSFLFCPDLQGQGEKIRPPLSSSWSSADSFPSDHSCSDWSHWPTDRFFEQRRIPSGTRPTTTTKIKENTSIHRWRDLQTDEDKWRRGEHCGWTQREREKALLQLVWKELREMLEGFSSDRRIRRLMTVEWRSFHIETVSRGQE